MKQIGKSGLVTIVALVAVAASVTSAAQGLNQPRGDLVLTLDCVDSTHITFAIRNIGESDTAVALGSVNGNGRMYLIYGLKLHQKTPSGEMTESLYVPIRHSAGIAGSVGVWIQAIPARSSYVMSAESSDFFAFRDGRMALPFARGVELSLTLTIPEPRREAMLRFYWSGTLTSNSCTP
jgi:hypothetical protein